MGVSEIGHFPESARRCPGPGGLAGSPFPERLPQAPGSPYTFFSGPVESPRRSAFTPICPSIVR
jgi:hypothetical protein